MKVPETASLRSARPSATWPPSWATSEKFMRFCARVRNRTGDVARDVRPMTAALTASKGRRFTIVSSGADRCCFRLGGLAGSIPRVAVNPAGGGRMVDCEFERGTPGVRSVRGRLLGSGGAHDGGAGYGAGPPVSL